MKRMWTWFLNIPTYRLIQSSVLVVLAIAFATSFQSGSEGARRLGFAAAFVASLPLVCDVVAGVATAIHGRVRKDREMRRLTSWFVLVPMLLSWGSNSIDHAYRAAPAAQGWTHWEQAAWYVAVVLAAGICPVAVAALLHLSTRFVEFEQRQSRRSEARPVAAPKASLDVKAAEPKNEVKHQESRRSDRVGWLREQPDMRYVEQVEAVVAQFGVSERTAKRVVAAAKEKAS